MVSNRETYCTEIAWQHGIPLIGSATRGDVWFLLEYPGRWEAKAFEQSQLPEAVKSMFSAIDLGGMRVRKLLIRHTRTQERNGFQFFIARTNPLKPRMYQYQLEDYQDLMNMDLISLASGQLDDPDHLREEPIFLVCTNGRRDRCCSVYGTDVYRAMEAEVGDMVWQSSHIGGHNQAPIALFLPQGVNYGRMTPSEARRLVTAFGKGEIVLQHYRGRVGYDSHVQAAEHFWREQTGVLDLPGMQVEEVVELGDGRWAVTIHALDGSKRVCVHIMRLESDYKVPITCSGKKKNHIYTFQRLNDL